MRKLGLTILLVVILAGCATIDTNSIDSLLEHKGSGLKKTYNAPSDTVFKVAKSLALHGPCANGSDIIYDEITGHIYSTHQGPYGMRTILWLMIIEPIADNRSQVEFIWSTQVFYSRGMNYDLKGTEYKDINRYCSAKVIFKGIEDYIDKKL